MKELYLRNVNNTYYKLDKSRKFSCYHDPERNNLLIFSPYKDCTIKSVCNATVSPGAYEYLTEVLNTSKNVVIHWSEVSGTTSDYIIYRNLDINYFLTLSYNEIMPLLPESNLSYKFTEFKNGIQEIIKFPKENKNNGCSKNKGKTISMDFETEKEAAGAYNIMHLIIDGPDGDEWNDVPISIETFNKVINYFKIKEKWIFSEQDMRWLKNMLRVKFGMDFKADA